MLTRAMVRPCVQHVVNCPLFFPLMFPVSIGHGLTGRSGPGLSLAPCVADCANAA